MTVQSKWLYLTSKRCPAKNENEKSGMGETDTE